MAKNKTDTKLNSNPVPNFDQTTEEIELKEMNTRLLEYGGIILTILDFAYFSVLYYTSDNPWLSLFFAILFPGINLPALKISNKTKIPFIRYTLTFTLIPMFLVTYISGPNAPGWLLCFSGVIASQLMIENKWHKRILIIGFVLMAIVGSYFTGKGITELVIIFVTLLAFSTFLTRIFSYMVIQNSKMRETNSEIKNLQQTLNIALEASNTGIWQYDLRSGGSGNMFMHDQWFKQIGYTRDEFEDGQDVFNMLIHPEDKDSAYQAIEEQQKGLAEAYETEFRLKAKDGSWKWILSKGQVVERDTNGTPTQLTGAHLDITERKKAESELRSLQQTLNIALEASNTGIWKINPITMEALYYGDQWFKQLGYSRCDFSPKQNVFDLLLHPDDVHIVNKALDEHKSGREDFFQAEFRFKAKDGIWKWIQSKGQVVERDDEGQPIQMTGAHLDVTEQKKAEAALKESHDKITDSIKFASMIQNALLPDQNILTDFFTDSFAIWEPKDVVGGDIFFIEKLRNDNELILFVIDCTGHGVPGALVTAIVKAVELQALGEVLASKGEISPARVLSFFNIKLKYILKQDNKDADSNAGFDGGVLYYNKAQNIVKFAGAETPLFYIQDNKINIIKGDRHSIGYKKSDAFYQFKDHTIEVDRETCFYMVTDGFLDQNGGTKGYPYGKKQFKQLLLDNYQLDFAKQKKIYLETIDQYRGTEDQTDDMTFVGLKIR